MNRPSNKQIDKAGKTLKNGKASKAEEADALRIVNDWRSLHAYPLNTFQASLRQKAKKVDVSFIFAQRLKKLKSIKEKLGRTPNMQLSTMQDIGGCRIVVNSLEAVYNLRDLICKSRAKHELIKENDYIKKPKTSGYRSLHLVYKYQSRKFEAYNGLHVEIQIRTKLQHIWATAVETASLITETSLKASEGANEWLRFFMLMSSCFALQEGVPLVPNTPETKENLVSAIVQLNKENDFITKLQVLRTFTNIGGRLNENCVYYLLYINKEKETFTLSGYTEKQYEEAYSEYISREASENSVDNVVLVSTNSIESLKSAYPNYFADMNEFIVALKNILE